MISLITYNLNHMKTKSLIPGIIFLFVFTFSISFANNPVKVEGEKMPDNVKTIVDKSCYGCHNSDSKNKDAKEEFNFDKMEGLSFIKKVSAYKNIGETVEENEMPPKKFLSKYPDKKLTQKEKETLITWAKKEAELLVKSK